MTLSSFDQWQITKFKSLANLTQSDVDGIPSSDLYTIPQSDVNNIIRFFEKRDTPLNEYLIEELAVAYNTGVINRGTLMGIYKLMSEVENKEFRERNVPKAQKVATYTSKDFFLDPRKAPIVSPESVRDPSLRLGELGYVLSYQRWSFDVSESTILYLLFKASEFANIGLELEVSRFTGVADPMVRKTAMRAKMNASILPELCYQYFILKSIPRPNAGLQEDNKASSSLRASLAGQRAISLEE